MMLIKLDLTAINPSVPTDGVVILQQNASRAWFSGVPARTAPGSLISTSVRAYDSATVLRLRAFVLLAVLLSATAGVFAQATNPRAPVDVIGQVHAPSGGPLQQNIRVMFQSDDGSRPPDIVFSDSNGRFVLYRLSPDVSYTVTVEGDGTNYETATVRFVPMGRRPTLQIYLRAVQRKPAPGGASVSAVELSQEVPRAARKLFDEALELIVNGESEPGRVQLLRALKVFPDFVEAHNELAVLLMKSSDLPGAETHLRRAVEIDSSAVRALSNLGLCLQRQQRYADSLPFLKKAVQLQPDSAMGHMLYGIGLMKTRDFDLAEPTLARAHELGGARAARAQYYLSWIATQRKDFPRAIAALEIFLREAPNDPDAEALQQTLTRLRAASTNGSSRQP